MQTCLFAFANQLLIRSIACAMVYSLDLDPHCVRQAARRDVARQSYSTIRTLECIGDGVHL